jgi:uncharacterized membrane protein YfhO
VHPAGPQEIRIAVRAQEPALLVVRVPFDDGWHATMNGRPVTVLRADYFLQAVSVPAGTSDVTLSYDDPRIGEGLLASAVVWIALFAALGFAVVRERRRVVRPEVTDRANRAAAPPDGLATRDTPDPPPGS